MVGKVQRDFGQLDILLNNVGIQYVAPVHEFPDDKWDAMIAITLSSAFHATKAALPAMMERQWGRIINTGSMHALVASPYKSAYNAAKHGIAGEAAELHQIACLNDHLIDADDSPNMPVSANARFKSSSKAATSQQLCLS